MGRVSAGEHHSPRVKKPSETPKLNSVLHTYAASPEVRKLEVMFLNYLFKKKTKQRNKEKPKTSFVPLRSSKDGFMFLFAREMTRKALSHEAGRNDTPGTQ